MILVLERRKPLLYKILSIREATIGEGAGAKKPALVPPGLLLLATVAVAWHENGEAVLGVAVRLKLRRLWLEPADGPVGVVGVGAGQAPTAVGRDDDHVVLPVDTGLPAAAAAIPDPPRARAAAAGAPAGVERDGVGLPEPGGEVREGGARQPPAGVLVGGRHRRRGAAGPQPLREAAQRHGHGGEKKRKNLASREKKKKTWEPLDRTKNRGEIRQNSAFPWICRVENLKQRGYLSDTKKPIHK